jgi:hypothetical protein
MISDPNLEAEAIDVNWDVFTSRETLSDRVQGSNFLRLYLRANAMKRVVRIEPEINASNLLEGIGGMAEYLMIVLYFLPLSCMWCCFTGNDFCGRCKRKRMERRISTDDGDSDKSEA